MIVRQFISWVRTASACVRADATRALARAWLVSGLSEEDRAAAEGALLMQLDDPSPLVRQAMAEVFARSAQAPAAIVQALSLDQPSVAVSILEHSPLLIDADLVDIVATGNSETQCAIARRIKLPASVCAAIAEEIKRPWSVGARRLPIRVCGRGRRRRVAPQFAKLRRDWL